MHDPYAPDGRLWKPPQPVRHDDASYAPAMFATLCSMQERHFWYRGRHRFLLHAVHCALRYLSEDQRHPRAIDLGGGCGGWARYLLERKRFATAEIAVGDSSTTALDEAARHLPPAVRLYHLDLQRLRWEERWDLAFLLDVLEHLDDESLVLAEVHRALAPGGLLFITVPAFERLWSWNDDAVGHRRRYTREQLAQLAIEAGFQVLDKRYFMFLLGPVLLLYRWASRSRSRRAARSEVQALLRRAHHIPPRPLNVLLSAVFACETPLGHRHSFPWGTSLLLVAQRRA